MEKKIIILIIMLIPLISFSQNRLIIEPNLNIGTIKWIEKYYIENFDDTSDPLGLQPTINFSGSVIGYGLNIKYIINRTEIGLSSQFTNFNGNPKTDQNIRHIQYTRNIAFDSFLEYGISLGYNFWRKNSFRSNLNFTGGSFLILNMKNANDHYKNRYFLNPEIEFSYRMKKIIFNVVPNYKYYYTVGENNEGHPVFEEFVHTFNVEFGIEYNLR